MKWIFTNNPCIFEKGAPLPFVLGIYTMIHFSTNGRRSVTLCNTNYSPEGILHPDRTIFEYDLLYMLNGSWNIIENNTCIPVHSGQLLILEPGLHHYSTEKCSPHMRNMFIHCSQLSDDILSTDTCADLDNLSDKKFISLNKLTDCKNNPQITVLFKNIIEAYWNCHDKYIDLRLGNMLELLLIEIAAAAQDNTSSDTLIKEILSLFPANSERFYTLDELSEIYGISSRTLSSRFKQATGESIHKYQIKLKLNMAHEQLPLNPSRGLRDIALSLGFYDEFQFSKLYKKQFGCSPSESRKRLLH